jgi:cell division protein FtsI/penicillin-binding protein 2
VPETPEEHARVGSAVALDVHSGDVLAMVSEALVRSERVRGRESTRRTWKRLSPTS